MPEPGPAGGEQLARCLAQTFGRTVAEIIRARHLVDGCLGAWALTEEDRSALVLVADELVTNAVRHGRGSVELYLDASTTAVRIEVRDKGGGRPRLQPVDRPEAWLGGRGLRLVDQLVDSWDTTVRPGHTAVWAQRTLKTASGPTLRPPTPPNLDVGGPMEAAGVQVSGGRGGAVRG